MTRNNLDLQDELGFVLGPDSRSYEARDLKREQDFDLQERIRDGTSYRASQWLIKEKPFECSLCTYGKKDSCPLIYDGSCGFVGLTIHGMPKQDRSIEFSIVKSESILANVDMSNVKMIVPPAKILLNDGGTRQLDLE